MPRKSRRSKEKRRHRIVPSTPPTQARPDRIPPSSSPRQQFASREATTVAQFAQRYRYAIRDIKRTSIVAAICVAVLVGLYFLLN